MSLTVRQIRRLLKSATGLLGAATCGVLWWAWQTPIAEKSAHDLSHSQEGQVAVDTLPHGVALEDFTNLWAQPLRAPLDDPVPQPVERPQPVTPPPPPSRPPPAPRSPPPPELEIRLVGTVIEAGRSMAIMADATGKIDLKHAGEVLDLEPAGVRVDEIQAESVTVSYQGRQSRLTFSESATDEGAWRRNER